MRETLDAEHVELSAILDELLASDVDITAREVARRHSALKNASAFTRHKERAALIDRARTRQNDARSVRHEPMLKKAATLAEQLDEKSATVATLERQVKSLVASHVACVRAVMQHGGMQSLQRFWADYRDIAKTLAELDALPSGAEIIEIGRVESVKGPAAGDEP